ncbi:MAG: methyl-accepting chemotaxis protein [Myxococcota bacterium]|jgi:methyl-accepting chemotaxis protein|nr:methyl-accepting chemotaxis protein [Myxococcota bacterium]
MSIKVKLVVPFAVIILIITTAQLWILPLSLVAGAREALQREAMALAALLAHGVGPSLEFDDPEMAKEFLEGVGGHEQIRFVGIYKSNGELFNGESMELAPEGAIRSYQEGMKASAAFYDDVVVVTSPISSRGGTTGVLVLGLSTESIDRNQEEVFQSGLILGGAMMILVLIIGIWQGTSLGSRIQSIAANAERIAAGDLTFPPVADRSNDEIGKTARSFDAMRASLRRLEEHMGDVARGDLARTVDIRGDLASAFSRMLENQREMVKQISDTVVKVSSTSSEFFASSQQQLKGSEEQTRLAERTRETMALLLAASDEIAKNSQLVLRNAESTNENSQIIAERISRLQVHSDRIGEVLEVIKDIAQKSDLLALNAALEGTKAGEAGRGFSLVANQMQRLAESVMGSVSDIKSLTADIRESTRASGGAAQRAVALAVEAMESARRISAIAEQQQNSTEDVSRAMDDVVGVAQQSALGSRQIVIATGDMVKMSDQLQELVGKFQLPGAANKSKDDSK